MARQKRGRAIDGILLLDKPLGMSSNQALQHVKRLFNAQKAGHTGSLDPLASGMLPLCFGEATKFSQYLLDADKVYEVTGKLGIKTASGDCDGEIIQQQSVEVTQAQLEQVLERFRGEQNQVPPMYSALKHQGQPLYALARQGITIERKARAVHIYDLSLLDFTSPDFTLRVHCSKGTYIRSLIDDIGDSLGCGAHVTVLRRTQCANFAATQMLNLEHLRQLANEQPAALEHLLLPTDTAVANWPEIVLSDEFATEVQYGRSVLIAMDVVAPGWVRLTCPTHGFLGIAEYTIEGKIMPRRMLCTKT